MSRVQPDQLPTAFVLADALKALGDPLRLSIFRVLQRDSFGVLELCDLFSVRQPAMSHHLKVMVEAGLLCSRREGNSLFYRRLPVAQSCDGDALKTLGALVDREGIEPDLQLSLEQLKSARTEQSLLFFQKNATRFRDQQDLIASYADYGAALVQTVKSLDCGTDLWIEVGSGAGDFLLDLEDLFTRVVALDVSADLLALARSRLGNKPHIQFVQGEISGVGPVEGADLVSCNMVLHHVASPFDLVAGMAGCLKPGGFLLISDLCQHDQEWARQSCGDVWLGLDPDELMQMAVSAGLEAHADQFLALRNGFRIQIQIFKRPEACSHEPI